MQFARGGKKKREKTVIREVLIFIDLNRPKKTVVRGSLCIAASMFQP